MAADRKGRTANGRPRPQGEAYRRDPEFRQPGNADRHHHRSDGAVGTGYSYTIGTGGSSVMRLLADHLAPRLIGRDADRIEAIWHELEFATHATTIGAMTAIALAAIDTALWDLRARKRACRCGNSPAARKDRCPLYTTEGGWLHIEPEALVEDALKAKAGVPRLQGEDRQAPRRGGFCAARGGSQGGRRWL